MKRLSSVDLSSSARAFGISQAPLFLMRELQNDASVRAIAETYSAQSIYEELARSVKRRPVKLTTAAKPYAFLVALSLMPNAQYLQKASRLKAPFSYWYKQIAEALVASYKPLTHTTVSMPTRSLDRSSLKSTTSNNESKLEGKSYR